MSRDKARLFLIYEHMVNLARAKYSALLKKDIDQIFVINEKLSELLEELRSPEYGTILMELDDREKSKLRGFIEKLQKWNERNKVIIESSLSFIHYVFDTIAKSSQNLTYNPFNNATQQEGNTLINFRA